MKETRSQILIKNEFQQELIMSTLLISLITLNVIIIAAFILEDLFGAKDHVISVFNLTVGVLELVAIVIVYYVGRRISFRIAGPVYAIERTLNKMADGDLQQTLHLRPGDHFEEVADAINDTMEMFRSRLLMAQSLANQLQDSPQKSQLLNTLDWFKTRDDMDVAATAAVAAQFKSQEAILPMSSEIED